MLIDNPWNAIRNANLVTICLYCPSDRTVASGVVGVVVVIVIVPTMTSIKNSFCAFLARVKTYTHTNNYTCTFTGSHLRAVTDNDDNAGCHSTITRAI